MRAIKERYHDFANPAVKSPKYDIVLDESLQLFAIIVTGYKLPKAICIDGTCTVMQTLKVLQDLQAI